MSESEETVFVEKMAEVEAEPFQKDLKDLMDMNEQPAIFDEQPVSSTTDKLADFLQPDVQESDPGPEEPELVEAPSSSSSTQQQEADPPIPTTIEDPVEQEPVSSSESPPPAPEAEQTHETNDEVLPEPETERGESWSGLRFKSKFTRTFFCCVHYALPCTVLDGLTPTIRFF